MNARELAGKTRAIHDQCDLAKMAGVLPKNCDEKLCDECVSTACNIIADDIERIADLEPYGAIAETLPISIDDVRSAVALVTTARVNGLSMGAIEDRVMHVPEPDMSRYVLLPVDKDGVPIHVGDTVWIEGDPLSKGMAESICYHLKTRRWTVEIANTITTAVPASYVTHTNPRTLDDVIASAVKAPLNNGVVIAYIREAYEIGMKEAEQ